LIDGAGDRLEDAGDFVVDTAVDAAEWTWDHRKQIATVAVGAACVVGSAGTCLYAGAIAYGLSTVDNTSRQIADPCFGFWHAQFGDTLSLAVGSVPSIRLLGGAERLLPASRGGRYAVNAYLTAPGTTAGLIYR